MHFGARCPIRTRSQVRPGAGGGPWHGKNLIHVDELDDDERAVWGVLSGKPKHPDAMAAALGLPIMTVQRALLQLLLRGLAAERTPGRYARTGKAEQR